MTTSRLEEFIDFPVDISEADFDSWLETQDDPKAVGIISHSNVPLEMRMYNYFDYMIKSAVKPSLSDSDFLKNRAVQTISAAQKNVNAIFCPLFRRLKARWLSVLKRKYVYFTDLSNDEFETYLNDNFCPRKYLKSHRVENDIGKYDKSMRLWTLILEVKIYRTLGLPQYLCDIWYNSHVLSKVVDKRNGFAALLVDTLRPLKKTFAWPFLSDAIAERYNCPHHDFQALFHSMCPTVESYKKNSELYYTLPHDVLCYDPNLPSLEV